MRGSLLALLGATVVLARNSTLLHERVAVPKPMLLSPISTNSPTSLAGGTVQCASPPVSSFFAGINPPYPTNSWWAPYAATPGTGTAAGPFPYESALDAYGVIFGVSTSRKFDGSSIQQPTQTDWRASFVEAPGTFANHKTTGWDTQAVTVQYFQGSATMTSYLVPGSPYMTFQYAGATPLLTSMNGGIASFNGKTLAVGASSSVTGTEFTVVDTTGTTYLIYALSSITLKATSVSTTQGQIQASGAFTGVLRLAQLGQSSYKTTLDQYSATYPTAVALDYSYASSTSGTITFTWNVVGTASQLLMLTWPHHRAALVSPNYLPTTSLSYLTTKGYMYPALGNVWKMTYSMPGITWNPPRALDSSCNAAVLQGLIYEVGLLNVANAPVPGDFYNWGGTLAAQARLALIADNLGRSDLVNKVVQYLEASFAPWFQASASTLAAYETTWGGVVNKAGAADSNIDYGNGFFNDHHFHYGYFLTVAAVIGKYDGAWLTAHRDTINFFARDIINPSPQDPYFPVTRCRDWFAGHSWASGIANGAGSRDQESSGEAVNGYYGALLWASTTLSQDYVNYANLLLASEIQATQIYWHLYPSKSATDLTNPYPETGVRALATMGNVEDWQSGAWLFWGSQKSEIAAIQILPVTPDKEALYDAAWLNAMWAYTAPEMADPTVGDEWKCVIIAAYANANPQVAAAYSANVTNWGSGDTYTNNLHFIGTRPNPSGAPICGALKSNPVGNFKLQAVSSGKYVVASASNTNLVASGTSASAASTFASAWLPNAGTLQLSSTSQFVTADSSGSYALGATRASPSSWETFIIRPKSGAAAGTYSIKASSNGLYIVLGSDGSLINSGTTEGSSAGFKFVAA